MKLGAIYCIFDGEELLEGSIRQIRNYVDFVLAVVDKVGRGGEVYNGGLLEAQRLLELGLIDKVVTSPEKKGTNRTKHETDNRQFGISFLRAENCTHFLFVDCDEYYISSEFEEAKKFIQQTGVYNTYCTLETYFAKPTLKLESREAYFVPFICRLDKGLRIGNFGWWVLCDPTRKTSTALHKWGKPICAPIVMHHFSYIRNDLRRKIKNSSAYANIAYLQNVILDEAENAKEGNFCTLYQKYLVETENLFNIAI